MRTTLRPERVAPAPVAAPSVAALALAALVFAAGALAGCDVFLPTLEGSGTIVREERPTAPVHRVVVAGGDLDVRIRIAPQPSLAVEGDDNLLPHLVTETLGDVLSIRWARGRYAPTQDVRLEVALPGLDHLELAGAVSCSAEGLDAARLDATLAGACSLTLAGRADALFADLAGACRLAAFDLAARAVTVDLAGACHADVQALDTLAADANGACDVRYRGDPSVSGTSTGVSSVRPD